MEWALALFRKNRHTVEDLIHDTNAAFEKYTPDDEYFESVLKPVLPRLYAAFKVQDFRSVNQLDAIAAPLRSMPPVAAALCAAAVLNTAGRLLTEDPLGVSLTQLIASAGMAGAWKAVPLVNDQQTVRHLISALDVLWRFEPSPYREVDHAQTVYVSGHLALTLGLDHDALTSRWRKALQLLAEVDPALARSATERDGVANTKRHLEQEWREQLAALSAAS